MQCALWMQIGRGDLTKTLLHAMQKVMSGRCWANGCMLELLTYRGFKERVEREPSGWSRSKWRRPKLTTLRGWWGRKLLARSTESVPRVVITNNNRRNPLSCTAHARHILFYREKTNLKDGNDDVKHYVVICWETNCPVHPQLTTICLSVLHCSIANVCFVVLINFIKDAYIK